MEASAAGQAAQGQAAGNGNGDAAEGGGQPDLAAIAEQLKGTATGQEEMRAQVTQLQEFLQTQPWQAEPAEGEGEQETGDVDLSFLDYNDQDFDAAQTAEKLGGVFAQTVEPLKKELAQTRQELADIRRDTDFRDLAAEIPELQDEEVAKEFSHAVRQVADNFAQRNGQPGLADVMANDPQIWKILFMAGKAAELANEEGAETPTAAHLEGGGGAAPAGSQVDPLGPMFDAAKGGRSVLPF